MDTETTIARDWFPIGHRAELSTTLSNSPQYLNGLNLAANMVFCGQKENIITALGADNVMFIDGSNAYWMDGFIKAFRKAKLYL
jgi:hypothetical protein